MILKLGELTVRVITWRSAVHGTWRSAEPQNPFFAPKTRSGTDQVLYLTD